MRHVILEWGAGQEHVTFIDHKKMELTWVQTSHTIAKVDSSTLDHHTLVSMDQDSFLLTLEEESLKEPLQMEMFAPTNMLTLREMLRH
jgi:hypothetical protein